MGVFVLLSLWLVGLTKAAGLEEFKRQMVDKVVFYPEEYPVFSQTLKVYTDEVDAQMKSFKLIVDRNIKIHKLCDEL